jgi:hypothetical protein
MKLSKWPRHAKALDMRLAGATNAEIGQHFGVSRGRAQQMVTAAKKQLAFRVFKGLERPDGTPPLRPPQRQRDPGAKP